MGRSYDELFELVLENTLADDFFEGNFVAEESSVRKQAKQAYKGAKNAADEYRSAKDEYHEAKRRGNLDAINAATQRVKDARNAARESIKDYRDLKAQADNTFFGKASNWGSSKINKVRDVTIGGDAYKRAKKAASDFASSSKAKEVKDEQKRRDDDAYNKGGIFNKIVHAISQKKEFFKGAVVGVPAGALMTGIAKGIGASLLSIAAIRAAGGVARAGKGVLYAGKAKHSVANARAAEMRANAKVKKAEAKGIKIDSETKRKMVEAEIAKLEKESKKLDAEEKREQERAKLYEKESKKLQEELEAIETEVKKYVNDYNRGKLDKETLQKKLSALLKKAKSLQKRSANVQKSAEKSITESAEFCNLVVDYFCEYVMDDDLEFIDVEAAVNSLVMEYVITDENFDDPGIFTVVESVGNGDIDYEDALSLLDLLV